MESIHDRLLGKLSLDKTASVESALVLQVKTKEILYVHNIADPSKVASSAFAAYVAATALKGSPDFESPYLVRVQAKNTKSATQENSYCTVYSDGTYLMYADIRQNEAGSS